MTRSERRKDPRVGIPFAIKYRLVGKFLEMWNDGLMTDLSAGGVRCVSAQPLDRGDQVELQITLPNWREPFLCSGRIVWQKDSPAGPEHGVSFMDVTPDKQIKIDELVQFLIKERPEAP